MIVDLEKKWLNKARCRGLGTDLFFVDHGTEVFRGGAPTKQVRDSWEKAKLFCLDCPVMVQCLRDSLGEPEGVWGGTDPQERRKMREKNAHNVRHLKPGPLRREYARLAHRLLSHPRYTKSDVARILGITYGVVEYLADEHAAVLKAQQATQKRSRKPVAPQVLEIPRVIWPRSKSPADGWIHRRGDVVHAYYLGETEDGEWLFMKGPISGKEDSMSWFRKRDVKLTRDVGRTIKERVGEQSRIYGTTISPRFGASTQAG